MFAADDDRGHMKPESSYTGSDLYEHQSGDFSEGDFLNQPKR